MRRFGIFLLALLAFCLLLPACSGGGGGGDGGNNDDPLMQACIDQNQGDNPWCYVDQLIAQGDPDHCEDVLQYWDDQDKGMVGECLFQIAQTTSDCSLCDRIEKTDLRDSCRIALSC